ncbi:PDDEXK-like family protein [Paraburkholderia sediminicola]|uniref:PDDEXK-like family protein n=1 Tax=Paraburkholderia sediminicola TaxID=458836 RepID=UPI0038BAE5A5
MDDAFQEFVADPRLRRATELLKRSNDIFKVIQLSENQHSEILKWLFDPREGHGQGDAILKDFLTAAYGNSFDNVGNNRDFFAAWTPSRIARTGFHSMIATREYVLPSAKRLDLMMVDPVNKMLVVIENKHGSKLGSDQLESYYREFSILRNRPAFAEYLSAYIVLDRNFGGAKDEESNRIVPRNRWAFLDYQWLEAGAERAELQLKRGNQSAALVIAYCQNQTDYELPELKDLDDLLADVAQDYREVVEALEEASCRDIATLTPGTINGDIGEFWIFANHYPDVVARLAANARLSYIDKHLRAALPGRDLNTDFGDNRFWIDDTKWDVFKSENWKRQPLAVHGWEMKNGDGLFAVGIQYRPQNLSDDSREQVQQALENEFPELKRGRQNASFRMLGKIDRVTEPTLAGKAQSVYLRLEKALQAVEVIG